MKFKYTGEDDCFCIELLAYKLVDKGSYLKKGQIIEVPNDLTNVISALDVSGQFHRVQDKKVTKKVNKKKEDKE
jgi:hypothetical protein